MKHLSRHPTPVLEGLGTPLPSQRVIRARSSFPSAA